MLIGVSQDVEFVWLFGLGCLKLNWIRLIRLNLGRQENKVRLQFHVKINAPIEVVYQVSQDYSVRYEWDSFPEKITLFNGAQHFEKGVCVSVVAKNGLNMEVEFV